MEREVDVVIIGLGTGGEDLALQLLDAGLEVAGVEPALVGGECPYWACIPSKMAVRAANVVAEGHRVNDLAGRSEITPDWSQVASRIRNEATGNWDDSYAVERFRSRGGYLVRGWGRIVAAKTVDVGEETIRARHGVVVATGSKPVIPPVPGLSDVDYWTTHEAIAADPLPASLIILGGGAVGCELGQVFARFGADVTIVEGHRLLAHEEPVVSELIQATFEEEGIEVVTGCHATQVSRSDDSIEMRLDTGERVTAERLLVATGRTVDTSELGLESVGIVTTGGSIDVDGHMRAGEGVWAMGDVTGRAMFTHVALYQGNLIANQILDRDPAPANYDAIPRVTFTDPEVASVGVTEAEASERGLDVSTATKNVQATFRGWLHGPGNSGLVKLVVDQTSDTLVGATVVGPNAGEILGLLTVAVHEKVSVASLRRMIYPFPTFHGAIGEAIGAYGRGTGTVIDPDYTTAGILG